MPRTLALSNRRFSLLTWAMVLLASSLLACAKPQSTGCGAFGLICPEGTVCSSDGASCITLSSECGDGVMQFEAGEQCDDGNRSGSDGCSADCKSTEECGNGQLDLTLGEVCDDGNTLGGDGCSEDCLSRGQCGNGILDMGEECDDGNLVSEDNCLNSCRLARCGDGFRDLQPPSIEACDPRATPAACNFDCTQAQCGDGIVNSQAGEECDNLGAVNTRACTAQCKGSFCGDGFTNPAAGEQCDDANPDDTDSCLSTCRGNVCGDGIINAGSEVCDDGNTVTETSCPYGTTSCTRCSATCDATLSLTGGYCGDGVTNGSEACDDRNAQACGTCSATCAEAQSAKATGTINAVSEAQLLDGETFSISDGINRPLLFEFDKNGAVQGTNVRIALTAGSSSTVVADAIVAAINGVPGSLAIIAVRSTRQVRLTHDFDGGFGNQMLTEQVVNSGFWVLGMSGGTGFNCPAGTGCLSNSDCEPGLLCGTSGTCQ